MKMATATNSVVSRALILTGPCLVLGAARLIGPAAGATGSTSSASAPYEITRSHVGGGAMHSTGGSMELSGSIGQSGAGALAGGGLELTGGFWFEIPVGDCDSDGIVGWDDIHTFSGCADGPGNPFAPAECVCSDFDFDGDIDLRDFAALQNGFAGQ